MQLTQAQINILLDALNSHEGVVAVDYERAVRLNSVALIDVLKRDLAEIRKTAAALVLELRN
jgi:hypothetical protein